jgi:transposase InsO family protein
MTSKFNYVVCSIEESNDVTTLTIDELQSSLLVHEQRMKFTYEKDEEQALKISSAGRGSNRGRGRNSGRGRGRGRQNKDLVECYRCHKLGHYQNECPTWEEGANYAEFNEREEVLLMAQESSQEAVYDDSNMEMWFLDSGCSNHMVGRKDWLFNFDESFREMVKLGDNSKMPVMGKGSLKLHIGGMVQVITEVYYLPGLKNNLLSIGQLQQKNLTIVFSNDLCKVYHESRGLIMSTQMSVNRMYIVHASVLTPMCMKVTKMSQSQLWHQRYGHLNYKGLNVLAKKEMVKGLPVIQETEETCEECIIGKQHRDSIPKIANWRATEKLQLVHSDICGPINPTSNGGSRYFITFTDDFSRKTWTYVLTEKANALAIFKKFKASAEKETNCQIKCLRTDRGGEFTSSAFNDFCSESGIKRQLTAAYTPQQNGVSERKNRTIMNMVRSMLAGMNVPKRFWPEAVLWATHVLNRSPTMSVTSQIFVSYQRLISRNLLVNFGQSPFVMCPIKLLPRLL